jgi:[ribosomal protein S18]-alanine N-acetyltransferase
MEPRPESLSITYRPMALEDVPRVREIDVLSFAMPWSERSYRFELTENTHSVTWVAEAARPGADPEIVGMIVVWVILDEAHIATIATHPDYRGLGIGKRLMAHSLLAAYQRGARLAYLEVRRSNLVAQNLYYQFGFQVVGERPRYYQDNQEDALLMTLEHLELEALQLFGG